MKARLRHRWHEVQNSYWFVPGLMILSAIALAVVALSIDEWAGRTKVPLLGWTYAGSSKGAQVILGELASSMIGLAGVVFSITIVALSVISGQLGPRLLRNFMRDRATQVSLGTFVGVFAYSVVVLRGTTLGREGATHGLSTTLGILLGGVAVAVLIYFLHHVSQMLQADRVVALVSKDLLRTVDAITEATRATEGSSNRTNDVEEALERLEVRALVRSQRDGYVQQIDYGGLCSLSKVRAWTVHVRVRPGKFVSRGEPLAAIDGEHVSDGSSLELHGAFVLGSRRTEEQDAEWAISQLVEVGLRALSPGVNEPFTALVCIDWLCAALRRVARAGAPARVYRDVTGRALLITDEPHFPGMLDAAFDQLRQTAADQPAVAIRMLSGLRTIGEVAVREEDRRAIRTQAAMILRRAVDQVPERNDREDIERRYRALEATLAERELAAGSA